MGKVLPFGRIVTCDVCGIRFFDERPNDEWHCCQKCSDEADEGIMEEAEAQARAAGFASFDDWAAGYPEKSA